jgi:hypothetical protein
VDLEQRPGKSGFNKDVSQQAKEEYIFTHLKQLFII